MDLVIGLRNDRFVRSEMFALTDDYQPSSPRVLALYLVGKTWAVVRCVRCAKLRGYAHRWCLMQAVGDGGRLFRKDMWTKCYCEQRVINQAKMLVTATRG